MLAGAEARLRDLDFSEDRIDLSERGATSFAQLDITTPKSGQLFVSFGSEAVRLDASAAFFTARHFIFAQTLPEPVGVAVRGTDGDDVLQGGDGDDLLMGGGGFDQLMAGNGDDILVFKVGSVHRQQGYGDAGADTFVFADGGSARVRDFVFSQDRVDLSDWEVAHFDDLAIALEDVGKLYVRHEAIIARFDATVDAFGAEHFTLAGDPAAFDAFA